MTVAEEITLDDPQENLGAQLVKEAASKTNKIAGDGTTTATVLAEAIYREGLKMIAGGADPMSLSRGLQKAADAVVAAIGKMSTPINEKSKKEITQVATIAGNNDPSIGAVLADAFMKVGKDGVITIEEGKQSETTVDVVEGMQFDRGYLSPHFVTNQEDQIVEFEKPLVLIHEEKITSAKSLVPLLEAVSKANKPLLDHRRGRRGRGPGDAGGQQDARHPQRLCRQGPGLRRSPQGHAGRHRHSDRRQRHLQGPGRAARFGKAVRPGHASIT